MDIRICGYKAMLFIYMDTLGNYSQPEHVDHESNFNVRFHFMANWRGYRLASSLFFFWLAQQQTQCLLEIKINLYFIVIWMNDSVQCNRKQLRF